MNVGADFFPRAVTLTPEQLAECERIAREVWDRAHEKFDRWAEPDEREAVANRIDKETANGFVLWGRIGDPYGDIPDDEFPPEFYCVGPLHFVADPVERVAVWKGDLPEERAWTAALCACDGNIEKADALLAAGGEPLENALVANRARKAAWHDTKAAARAARGEGAA